MEEELEKDMTPKLIGETYMKYPTEKSRQKYRYGLYECAYCGNEFETITYKIKSGHTRSCGCFRVKAMQIIGKMHITHGLYYTRFYASWSNIMGRCNNTKNKNYKNYGARGITVCEEWLNPKNFIDWAEATYPNIEGYSIDRIDNNKGYSPENCRWVDKTTQVINRRLMKNNTSGYVGVGWDKSKNKWMAKVRIAPKLINIGGFNTIEEAVQARDQYIIDNGLPHKLSTDYK